MKSVFGGSYSALSSRNGTQGTEAETDCEPMVEGFGVPTVYRSTTRPTSSFEEGDIRPNNRPDIIDSMKKLFSRNSTTSSSSYSLNNRNSQNGRRSQSVFVLPNVSENSTFLTSVYNNSTSNANRR